MGAKTGLLVYAEGEVPGLLRQVGAPDLGRTSEMMRRLYPGCEFEPCEGAQLWDGVYPQQGTAYAASWPGVEVVGDQRVMIDLPSQLPEHLVAASAGRRLVLHAMHSVVDPLAFERPYWAGERPADVIPWPDEDDEPYPLPFHPLELGEEALRALCGFVIEGHPEPDDIDASAVWLHGFRVTQLAAGRAAS
ncbi:hypothetical protein OG866_41115 [Streptomyces sp. NBC_00663]|uniref:DUF6928 family protein n=1 Tax=Streptomyces sp. NBC_00663 TaxID=2975801 RepID=UPI002E356072|nr:hypothetical protein [Streptomyces sp. NBC_00663]